MGESQSTRSSDLLSFDGLSFHETKLKTDGVVVFWFTRRKYIFVLEPLRSAKNVSLQLTVYKHISTHVVGYSKLNI